MNTPKSRPFVRLSPRKRAGANLSPLPGRSAARSEAKCCAAEPGSLYIPGLKRSRNSGAPLRAAPHPGNEAYHSGNKRREIRQLEPGALYRLLTWLSPAYPVGAFAYSSGIEWAVQAGDIADGRTLQAWLEATLTAGAGINDAILFAHAHRAVTRSDNAGLVEIAELAAAFMPTRERFQESTTLGRAFVEVSLKAWPCHALVALRESVGWSTGVSRRRCRGLRRACRTAGAGIARISCRALLQLGFGRRAPHSARAH